MSVEIYVQGFNRGEPAGLPLASILEMLSPTAGVGSSGRYSLEYDSLNSCEFSVDIDSGRAVSITVFRPCGDIRLYDALFAILKSGPYVAYAPGSPPFAADSGVSEQLPDGMVEGLGQVIEVRSGSNLCDALFAA